MSTHTTAILGTLYALPGTDSHLPAIKAHCMGDCNRLAFGIMIVDGYPCYVCTHADCPHIETELLGVGTSRDGHPITVRKVKP